MRLMDRTAIVTGAGSGFGAGIARTFAAEGARVIVADIDEAAARTVAAEVGGTALRVDVASAESVAAMAAGAAATLGRVDILVNNAGVTHLPALLEEVSEADFDRVFAVNCKSVYLTARALVPMMKKAGRGAILNVASTAGLSPRPRLNWYNASKGWMITATKAMAVELAPKGIRVNSICPTFIETDMTRPALSDAQFRAFVTSKIKLGRIGQVEDLMGAVVFLASDASALMTGSALMVDGGWTAG